MDIIGNIWNTVLLEPMLNFVIILSRGFSWTQYIGFGSFGIAIIILTIIVRLVTFPLTLKQLKASKAMSVLQPKMKELQKKYAGDRQRLSQETSKLYKEHGVSPLGCILPMLIQFPIWIALYQSIMRALAATPEGLLDLSQRLYSLSLIHQAVPLGNRFLWLDLGRPDNHFPYIMPILVGGTMWIQQKMSTMPSADPNQQRMSRMMIWMMPLMFGFFTLQFPSGLALFWIASNIIGIVTQYLVTGWGSLTWFSRAAPARKGAPVAEIPPKAATSQTPVLERPEKGTADGKRRNKRKDRRRGRRARLR